MNQTALSPTKPSPLVLRSALDESTDVLCPLHPQLTRRLHTIERTLKELRRQGEYVIELVISDYNMAYDQHKAVKENEEISAGITLSREQVSLRGETVLIYLSPTHLSFGNNSKRTAPISLELIHQLLENSGT